MISFKDLYNVLAAVVPLYVTMFLAYGSVKWWKVFTPDQCSGINRFVATFAVPLLSFEFISRINPFKMNFLFIAADSLSKALVLLPLFLLAKFTTRLSLDWAITLFSLSTLPNTLVMGIPLIKSMYGNEQESLMIQVVVLQSIIWYTLLLFLFEYRAAMDVIIRRIGEGSSGGSKDEEDDVVHVIVARPSTELEQQRVQMSSRVAPDSGAMMVEKGKEGECGRELHMFVWRCSCCNSQGVCEKSVKVCSREEGLEREVKDSGVGFKMIMKMVWFKLVKNPNTYASLLGVSWALASSKWGIKKPLILENSVTLLSDAGLGMAMFSLGLFMALQPKIIACGRKQAVIGMLIRFVASPAVMALASIAVGIRGTTFKVSLVQAALPQGIVPFVFAREYNLHPEVLSTACTYAHRFQKLDPYNTWYIHHIRIFICNCKQLPTFEALCAAMPPEKMLHFSSTVNVLGKSSSTIYAIALLASGQSSTITSTYAGQYIMQGFLDIKMRKWLRNLMTRCIAITPSLIVSIIGGSSGAGRLIIIASMILSFELPFALIPLLKFSSSRTKMGPHKNSIYIIVISWILGACIIGINIYYLSTGFVDWIIHNSLPKFANVLIGIIVFPLMAIYIISVLYLTFRKDTVVTFVDATDST